MSELKFKDAGPAFPTDSEHQNGPNTYHFEGMSLRDYFAGQALIGLATGYQTAAVINKEKEFGGIDIAEMLSALAYAHADAMLAERERTK